MFGFISICLLVLLGAAYATIEVQKVEVDDEVVSETDANRLDVERGNDIEVSIRLRSDVDMEDVEIEAFISGYEHSDRDRISDNVGPFDMDANTSYVKYVTLGLPDLVDEDSYLLRIIVSDRYGDAEVLQYKLKVDVPRHSVQVKDIILNPDGEVKAGRALLVTVRAENFGEKDEDSVKVRVSIPELGITASEYIDEVESEPDDNTEDSEELFLRIPEDAKAGVYTVRAELSFNDGYDKVTKETTIRVLEAEDVQEETPETPASKTIIAISTSAQDIAKGAAGAVYPVTITNSGADSKAYTLVVDGADEWADVRITPSNSMVINGGESRVMYIYVTAREGASVGQKVFTVSVNSNGETLKQIPLSANVVAGQQTQEPTNLRRALEIGLIVLVLILIILAFVVGFRKSRKDEGESDEEPTSQTYY